MLPTRGIEPRLTGDDESTARAEGLPMVAGRVWSIPAGEELDRVVETVEEVLGKVLEEETEGRRPGMAGAATGGGGTALLGLSSRKEEKEKGNTAAT